MIHGIAISASAENTISTGIRNARTSSAKARATDRSSPSLIRRLNSGTKAWAKAPSANSRRKMLGSWNASCQASAIPPAPSTRASSMSRAKPNTRLTAVSPPIVPTLRTRVLIRPPLPPRGGKATASSVADRRGLAAGSVLLGLALGELLEVDAVEVDRLEHQRWVAGVARRVGDDPPREREQDSRCLGVEERVRH